MTRRDFITKGAMATAGAAIAANVRSNLGGMHSRYVPNVPEGEYTAADYVQDGLIAQWDGIENAGYGMYDDTTGIWIDLARPDAVEWFNVGSDTVWSETGLILSSARDVGGTKNVNYMLSQYPDIDWTQVSYEYCFSCAEVANTTGEMITLTARAWAPLDVMAPWGMLRVSNGTNGSYGQNPANAFSLMSYIGGPLHGTFSISPSGLSFMGEMARPACTLYLNYADPRYRFRIGALGGSETNLHSVRIYSRTLSQDEVSYNWKIDNARFF